MRHIDSMYIRIIYNLFGIQLDSAKEIDAFCNNIGQILRLEQIVLLQSTIAEHFNNGSTSPGDGFRET